MDGGEPKKGPLPKICHTYPRKMNIGTTVPFLKKIQKIYKSRDKFYYIKKYGNIDWILI